MFSITLIKYFLVYERIVEQTAHLTAINMLMLLESLHLLMFILICLHIQCFKDCCLDQGILVTSKSTAAAPDLSLWVLVPFFCCILIRSCQLLFPKTKQKFNFPEIYRICLCHKGSRGLEYFCCLILHESAHISPSLRSLASI